MSVDKKLLESLEWMIENDDTRDIPSNGYWINGLELAKEAVAVAKGETYEAGDWDFWSVADRNEEE
jgi:hypothetical protein